MGKLGQEQLLFQIENKPLLNDGVYVKLEYPCMSDLSRSEEKDSHPNIFHRVWMLGEIEILNEETVEKLRKDWNYGHTKNQ